MATAGLSPQNQQTNAQDGGAPRLKQFLSWLGTAAGLTGILVTLGYVVLSAQQDLLGISVSGDSVKDYLGAAADLAIDIVTISLTWMGTLINEAVSLLRVHFIAAPLLIATGIAFMFGASRLGRRFSGKWNLNTLRKRSALVVLIAFVAFLHALYFGLPVRSFRGLLFEQSVSVDREVVEIPIVSARSKMIWSSIVCSRISSQEETGCVLPQAQGLGRQYLEHSFLVGMLGNLFLWGAALLIPMSSTGDGASSGILTPILWVLLAVALLVDSVSVLQVYGKTLHSLDLRYAVITFKPTFNAGEQKAPDGKPIRSQSGWPLPIQSQKGAADGSKELSAAAGDNRHKGPQASCATESEQPLTLGGGFVILAGAPGTSSLYLYSDNSDKVWWVDGTNVSEMNPRPMRDILQLRILYQSMRARCQGNSGAKPPKG